MKHKRYILLFVLLLAVSAGYYGWYMYNKPVESIKGKAPDVTISASALVEMYATDEEKANEKYLDKVIQVDGTVSKVQNNNIYLKTSNPMSSIICEMEKGISPDLLQPGEDISVKGVCTGYLLDVVLVRCTVIKN